MMTRVIKALARLTCMLVGISVVSPAIGFGEEPTTALKPLLAANLPRKIAFDPLYSTKNSLPDNWESHPLTPALNLARQRIAYIRENVRDFTCVLVKRERINGQLRAYEYLATKVRREQRQGDGRAHQVAQQGAAELERRDGTDVGHTGQLVNRRGVHEYRVEPEIDRGNDSGPPQQGAPDVALRIPHLRC